MTLFVFLIILSVLVLIHEFGHFIVAKRAGIRVEEFGLGFPPRIWAKKVGETTFSVNALFFGGFVRLYGEERPEREKERSFFDKPRSVRAAVISAGVLMNFLLAVASFATSYSILGIPRKVDRVLVVGVVEGSPAQEAGLALEDVLLGVDGQAVYSNQEFVGAIEQKKGEEVLLAVKRGEEELEISVVPRQSPPEGEGPLGIAITDSEAYFPPVWQRPFFGVYFGFREALAWAGATVGAVGRVLSQFLGQGVLPKDIAGPVGIFQITGEVTKGGYLSVLNFLGILSVNLAILNILPFPALDGGRLLFVGIEGVLGRRVVPQVERVAHVVGMAILLLLLLAITIQDIGRLITSESFSSFIQQVSP